MELQPSDAVFIALVLWIVFELTGGGGRRARVPAVF